MNRRTQAEEEFKTAVVALQEVVPEAYVPLIKISFPTTDKSFSLDTFTEQFGKAMDSILHPTSDDATREKKRKKASDLVIKLFQASYPFTRLFLSVAQSASAVFPTPYLPLILDAHSQSLQPTLYRVDNFDGCMESSLHD